MATTRSFTGYLFSQLGVNPDGLNGTSFNIATANAIEFNITDNDGDATIGGDVTNEQSSDADQFLSASLNGSVLFDGVPFYLESTFTFTVGGQSFTGYHFEVQGTGEDFLILPPGVPAGTISVTSQNFNPSPNEVNYAALSSGDENIDQNNFGSQNFGGGDTIIAGAGNDRVDAGAGNDSVDGGAGADNIAGNAGNDTIIGGDGADTIVGDGGDQPAILTRESFNWSQLADPSGDGTLVDNGDDISGGVSQNTGTINVALSVTELGRFQSFEYRVTNQNVTGIDSGGETINATSSGFLEGDGVSPAGDTASLTFDFSSNTANVEDEVRNVSFRINDVDDANWRDIVEVQAFNADGEQVPVTLSIGGNHTLTEGDGFLGAETVTANNGSGNQQPTTLAASILVEVDGPVSQIVVTYGNLETGGQRIDFTDIFFDSVRINPNTATGDDSILGGAGADVLDGQGGNDSVFGGADSDVVSGGAGSDLLAGGTGADFIFGGADADTIRLEDNFGADVISGGETGTDSDTIDHSALSSPVNVVYNANEAGTTTDGASTATFSQIENQILTTGADTLDASATTNGVNVDAREGSDSLRGGAGADTLVGAAGLDTFDGGAGNDSLFGGEDADLFIMRDGFGSDTIDGGEGGLGGGGLAGADFNPPLDAEPSGDFDTVDFSALTTGVTVTYNASETGIANAGANSAAFSGIERFILSANGDTLDGQAETASLNVDGGGGGDSLTGGSGGDFLVGGEGGDTLTGGLGADFLFGGEGNDSLFGGEGDDRVYAGAGDDFVISTPGVDYVYGGDGADTIEVGQSADFVFGGAGADSIDAGSEDDLVFGGAGSDTILGGDPDAGSGEGGGNDTLFGNDGADSIDGGEGDDSIAGGEGDDTILGGAGADSIEGDGGIDLNRESFNWDLIPDPNGGDPIDNNDDLTGGTVQDTGNVSVTMSYVDDGAGTAFVFRNTQQNIDGLDGGPEAVDDRSSAQFQGSGNGPNATVTLDFAANAPNTLDEVRNVQFRLNDIDEGGFRDAFTIRAFDGNGNPIQVFLTGGSQIILTDTDGVAGADTATVANNTGGASPTDLSNSVLVEIPGPVGSIEISYSNLETVFQAAWMTDVFFDAQTLNQDGGDDSILGGEGADTILGQLGSDTIDGGLDADLIDGGDDQDTIVLTDNFGADTIAGGEGGTDGDTLDQSALSAPVNVVYTGDEAGTTTDGTSTAIFSEIETQILTAGDDTLDATLDTVGTNVFAGDGADTLLGGSGADTIRGEAGDDTLNGAAGADSLSGGDDADTFILEDGFGADTISGGEGGTDNDTLDMSALTNGANVTFNANEAGTASSGGDTATFSQIENLILTEQNDTLDASATDDGVNVFAGGGDDTLLGGAGADTIDAGTGDDTIDGGAGSDFLTGGNGFDDFIVSAGNDTITDFNTADGQVLNDGDPTNNDFIDLAPYYDNLAELRADFADDGILNQSNTIDTKGRPVDYADNTALPGTITLNAVNGNELFTDNTNVVCFARGTLIRTARGEVAVEDLAEGDLVETRDNGLQPVRWIGRRSLNGAALEAQPRLRPIVISAGALGNARTLRVSPQHRMLVRSWRAELMFGEAEVLVKAADLVDGDRIYAAGAEEVEYFHILFDGHEIIFAEGAEAESFHPGEQALSTLEDEARKELLTLFPELAETSRPLARHSLKAYEAKALLH